MKREIEALSDRLERHVTQEELSKEARVSRKHLSELLNGKTGTETETLERIVEALHIQGVDRDARIEILYQAAELLPPKRLQKAGAAQAGSQIQTLFNGLNPDDQDDLIQLALAKWNRKYNGESISSPGRLPASADQSSPVIDKTEHLETEEPNWAAINLANGACLFGVEPPDSWQEVVFTPEMLTIFTSQLVLLLEQGSAESERFADVLALVRDKAANEQKHPRLSSALQELSGSGC